MQERLIWLDKDGNIVEEKDAIIGKVYIDDSPVFVLPRHLLEDDKKTEQDRGGNG